MAKLSEYRSLSRHFSHRVRGELFESRFAEGTLHEKEMASSDLDLDNVYNLFSQNYLKATGKTWTKDKFLSRAHDWTFFGSEEGMVAVRKQRSGLYKLVGSAGKPLAVAKGFKELIDSGAPVWGAVSADLLPSLKKAGMKSPPAWVVRTMIKHIPAGVWGGITPTVNKDGSITLDYADVGPATKFFIGSPAYYKHSLKMVGDKLPSPVKAVMEMYAKGKEVASGALSKFKSLFSKSSDSVDEEEA